MNVNNFGLAGKKSKSASFVTKKDLDSKFINLTKNLQLKVDKNGDTICGDLNILLGENDLRTFGISDISDRKSVSLLLGDIDNQIRHNWGHPIKFIANHGIKFMCPAGEVCHFGGKTNSKAQFLRDIVMNDNGITNLHNPNADQDAATKNYVDTRYILNNVGFVPNLFSNNKNKNGFEVSASSEKVSDKSSSAYNVFLNSRYGEWCTNGVINDFWIQLHCPERIRIHKFSLRGKRSGTERIYDWKFQGSNDTDVWDDLHTETNALIGNTISFYNVSTSTEYSNFRIFVVDAEGDNPGLSSWQLYTADPISMI